MAQPTVPQPSSVNGGEYEAQTRCLLRRLVNDDAAETGLAIVTTENTGDGDPLSGADRQLMERFTGCLRRLADALSKDRELMSCIRALQDGSRTETHQSQILWGACRELFQSVQNPGVAFCTVIAFGLQLCRQIIESIDNPTDEEADPAANPDKEEGARGRSKVTIISKIINFIINTISSAVAHLANAWLKLKGGLNSGRPLVLHHMNRALRRREIPDECLKAYTLSLCADEVPKCVRLMDQQ